MGWGMEGKCLPFGCFWPFSPAGPYHPEPAADSGTTGREETQAGTECSLRSPHPEMLICLGGYLLGHLAAHKLCEVEAYCEKWIVGRTGFLKCVRVR